MVRSYATHQDVAQRRALLQSVCRLYGPRSGVRLGAPLRVHWRCIPCPSASRLCRWMRCSYYGLRARPLCGRSDMCAPLFTSLLGHTRARRHALTNARARRCARASNLAVPSASPAPPPPSTPAPSNTSSLLKPSTAIWDTVCGGPGEKDDGNREGAGDEMHGLIVQAGVLPAYLSSVFFFLLPSFSDLCSASHFSLSRPLRFGVWYTHILLPIAPAPRSFPSCCLPLPCLSFPPFPCFRYTPALTRIYAGIREQRASYLSMSPSPPPVDMHILYIHLQAPFDSPAILLSPTILPSLIDSARACTHSPPALIGLSRTDDTPRAVYLPHLRAQRRRPRTASTNTNTNGSTPMSCTSTTRLVLTQQDSAAGP
ncbi:hypothetical protein B0H10DRAFT_2445452 [Mycena sp. CBHHK59/15]|nr:hypothetical protein B0H10DRAFT_2445452 [Mycena sp. CBHHK59/15]